MEYNTPSSYKNYLPSKKMQIIIAVLIIIGIGYFAIPPILSVVKKTSIPKAANPGLTVSLPTGDPTTRDTDRDGIPDWQEIAIGLDPNKSETKAGVPDMTTFQSIKNTIGSNTFDLESSKVTDTDKVSLTIYDALEKDSTKNNGVSVSSAQTVTSQELYNYIQARKNTIPQFTQKDLVLVESTLESNKSYYEQIKTVLANSKETNNAPQQISTYIDNASTKESITPIISQLDKSIKRLKTTPVPIPAAQTHLELLNSMKGVYEILTTIDPTNSDEIYKLSNSSLVQDYLMIGTKSLGLLSVYFNVALNPNGY